jgi:hypothetical protein
MRPVQTAGLETLEKGTTRNWHSMRRNKVFCNRSPEALSALVLDTMNRPHITQASKASLIDSSATPASMD